MFLWLLKHKKGFTLIELMIVITIIGILAAIAVPNYKWGVVRAKEAVLREDLYSIRSTIDQFFADQGKFPDSLDELVEKNYLRSIPVDPFTKGKAWIVVAPPPIEGQDIKGSVFDVHSESNIIGSNGTSYNEW
jgi:general secretion pathway protein G